MLTRAIFASTDAAHTADVAAWLRAAGCAITPISGGAILPHLVCVHGARHDTEQMRRAETLVSTVTPPPPSDRAIVAECRYGFDDPPAVFRVS